MLPALALRPLRSADKRCGAKFVWNFVVQGMWWSSKFGSPCRCQTFRDAAHFLHEHG